MVAINDAARLPAGRVPRRDAAEGLRRGLRVVEIDVQDDAAAQAFWRAGNEAVRDGQPYAVFWPLRTAREALQRTPKAFRIIPLAAVVDGEVIASAQVNLPQLDNQHMAYANPAVRAPFRRRGIGSALLEAAIDRCRADGRTTLIVEATRPLGRGVVTSRGLLDATAGSRWASPTCTGFSSCRWPRTGSRRWPSRPLPITPTTGSSSSATTCPTEYVDGFCASAGGVQLRGADG